MNSSDWDFYMPGTAIETTPLEKATQRIADMMQDTVTCPQVDCTGNHYAEFSLHVVCDATSPDSIQLELGQYLLGIGEKLIRHAYFDQGAKYGRNWSNSQSAR